MVIKYKFIEAMILVYGRCGRNHIERAFNIKSAAASRVMTSYRAKSGNNITKGKPDNGFDAVYLDIEPELFLESAQIMAEQQIIIYKEVLI